MVCVLKGRENSALKETIPNFSWQAGYGAFSVSPTDSPEVVAYIQNQEAHHLKLSFQDEYRQLLKELGIEFDEQHVWD